MWCREDTLFCVWVKGSVNISFVFFIYKCLSALAFLHAVFMEMTCVSENGVLKCPTVGGRG